MPATVVSCPGKVLLAGGYLVLEPEHAGLVVGTASRFYTVIQDMQDTDAASTSNKPAMRSIVVKSPQFRDAIWRYQLDYRDEDDLSLVQVSDGCVEDFWNASQSLSTFLCRPAQDFPKQVCSACSRCGSQDSSSARSSYSWQYRDLHCRRQRLLFARPFSMFATLASPLSQGLHTCAPGGGCFRTWTLRLLEHYAGGSAQDRARLIGSHGHFARSGHSPTCLWRAIGSSRLRIHQEAYTQRCAICTFSGSGEGRQRLRCIGCHLRLSDISTIRA